MSGIGQNDWEWLEITDNGWKWLLWLNIAENGQKLLEMDVNGFGAGNNQNFLTGHLIGWKCLGIAANYWIGKKWL